MGRRVLVTGVAGPWGSRVAAALERDPAVEYVVGVDRTEPAPGTPGAPRSPAHGTNGDGHGNGTGGGDRDGRPHGGGEQHGGGPRDGERPGNGGRTGGGEQHGGGRRDGERPRDSGPGDGGRTGRVEFVRTDASYASLAEALRRTDVDTIIHAALIVDGAHLPTRRVHEANVIGTMHLVAAAGQPGSRVTTMVVKSSTLVYGAHHRDPVWFREDTPRSAPPRHRTERSLVEVEEYVRDFAVDNPHVTLALLRCADVVGPGLDTPVGRALRLPLVPCVGGFDPRLQVVHEDDVVRAIGFVLEHRLGGTYNVAADGLVTWSEVASLCGRRRMPLPPMLAGHGLFAGPMARMGVDLPPELADLLTHGRGVDNRRLRTAGFGYRYTSVGAVRAFAEAAGLLPTHADALG